MDFTMVEKENIAVWDCGGGTGVLGGFGRGGYPESFFLKPGGEGAGGAGFGVYRFGFFKSF